MLYLTLKALQLDHSVREGGRHHTFLAIEEPEAHLHPHLQRLAYRDFLRPSFLTSLSRPVTVILTTHSPHIVSVAPLNSIVLLRQSRDGQSTEGVSTAKLKIPPGVVTDLERYLDVTRGEVLFAKGVILVEGESERYLLPALAKANNIDFDELGISVCSVGGTNFRPYVELLGARGLRLPVAVVTDGDVAPSGESRGEARILTLLETVFAMEDLTNQTRVQRLGIARESGFFVGDQTCEVDLFRSGAHDEMCDTLIELAPWKVATARAQAWRAAPDGLDPVQLLKDITVIGKARFAQRLSSRVTGCWPDYMKDAIEYVRKRCR